MRLRTLVAASAIAVLSVGASGRAVAPHRLEIVSGDVVVWSEPIAAGEPFDVSFVHSQERTLWTQHYAAGAMDTIRQTGSTFGSYGAGMPLDAVHRGDRGFTADTPRTLSSIPMLASHAARLTLTLHGRDWPLDRWFADYEAFAIRIR